MTCEEQIYSEEYYDFILRTLDPRIEIPEGVCTQYIDENYANVTISRAGMPELNPVDYSYASIPKCFALLDENALEVSGISQVLRQPTLSLTGRGVLVGFVDTGITYESPMFRRSDGSTRIVGIWDQTTPGNPPEGFLYGTEYTEDQINAALQSESPRELVPEQDPQGHGTFLAGIAAGTPEPVQSFTGAAPGADIAMVKLKEAKQYLKDYFFVSPEAKAYQETDLAAGIYYLQKLAARRQEPLVLCLALGTNAGTHKGNSILGEYLDSLGVRAGQVLVIAGGNEANARRHFRGSIAEGAEFDSAQIRVGENVPGFLAELWLEAPELATVTVTSPTGERTPRIFPRGQEQLTYQYVFEETIVEITFRVFDITTGDQMILIRFLAPTRGLWSIETYPVNRFSGDYHIWLPMTSLTTGEIFFIRSDPDQTITIPSTGRIPITVGAYDDKSGSLDIQSGRGFSLNGAVKPEFCAPGVEVQGINGRGDPVTGTGTSVAAAITAGAGALFLEWAALKLGYRYVNTVDTKNFLIRGARQDLGRDSPNTEWGYGKLDLYSSFDVLR